MVVRNLICLLGKYFFFFARKKRSVDPHNILIIRSGGIGDVLMSTPLGHAIRKHYPKAKITYFVGNWSKDVLVNNPHINEIYAYEDLTMIKFRFYRILEIIKVLRQKRFDLCFNLEKSWHWAVLSWLFGIPCRIGFDRKGEGFAHTQTISFDGTRYELDYYLQLGKSVDVKPVTDKMEVYLTQQDNKKAMNFIKKQRLQNKKIIGMSPGGADNPAQQAAIKKWPMKSYVKLVNRLLSTYPNAVVILFGGSNDAGTCRAIHKQVEKKDKVISTAGTLSIKESSALMKHCNVFVTHDSGPMHIAASVGVNLVALFGPTQSKRFAPRNSTIVKAPHKPCYDIYGTFSSCKTDKMMQDIAVDQVFTAVKNHMGA